MKLSKDIRKKSYSVKIVFMSRLTIVNIEEIKKGTQ